MKPKRWWEISYMLSFPNESSVNFIMFKFKPQLSMNTFEYSDLTFII